MLAFRADLHGIEETITRNVLITVVSDVKELLGMTHDVYTVFDEKDNVIKKKNRIGDVKGHNTFKEDMFNIEFTETTEEGHEMSLVPFRPDSKHIYHDPDVNTSITPIYLNKKLEVKIKYSNKSKSKIFSLTNKLKIFNSDNSIYRRHELEYHYTIPPFLIKLLAHINNLKNLRIPAENKLALEQYIDSTFDNRVDFSNTLDADITKSQLVIREAQLEVEGYVADDVHGLTPEYDETFNTWYVEFTYGFSYEKPVSLLVQYPILIYNTIIDKEFRTFIDTKAKLRKNAKVTAGRGDMVEVTERDNVFNIRDNSYYIRIPKYDNEVLPKPGASMARMFSVMNVLEEHNPNVLFNISHIPKIKFRENALNFLLESEYPYVGDMFDSLFYIELFKDGKRDYKNKILMDHLGNLTTYENMDIRSIYRVVFNVITDVTMLRPAAAKRFKRFCSEQLLDNKDKPSPTFTEFQSYWAGVDYKKYNQEVKTDSLITDYLTLLALDGNVVSNAIIGTNKYYEIPFAISQSSNNNGAVKNTQIQHTLRGILDEK